jgi:hypothetical protein
MLIRIEKIKGSTNLLVVSEVDKFLGEITNDDFISCWDDSVDVIEEDGYSFYTVDKICLFNSFLPKNK